MNSLFSFFLRLFICFVAAKLVVQAVDLNTRNYLLALTVLFLVNAYLFDYLVYRSRQPVEANPPEAEPDPAPKDSAAAAAPDQADPNPPSRG
jgi:hypothetical protein